MSLDLEKIKALAVRLQDRRIGVINRFAGDRQLFAFEQDYIDDPTAHAEPLFQGRTGALVTTLRTYAARVPPFFSNLLPEGHLRTYLAAQAGVGPERELFLLAALGADLPGALVVTPLADDGKGSDLPDPPLHDGREGEQTEPVLRFSLAGVQLKFSAIMEAAGGLTIPGRWDGGVVDRQAALGALSRPSRRMNTPCSQLARAVGIAVPPNRLVDMRADQGNPAATPGAQRKRARRSAVRPRPGGQRIHMEDFAQVFGLFPNDKYTSRSYANIAAVLWAETGEEGTYDFFRRLVFSVLIGNGDMHLKNWSLLYPGSAHARAIAGL